MCLSGRFLLPNLPGLHLSSENLPEASNLHIQHTRDRFRPSRPTHRDFIIHHSSSSIIIQAIEQILSKTHPYAPFRSLDLVFGLFSLFSVVIKSKDRL